MNNQEQEKLKESVLNKAPNNDSNNISLISINKIFKRILIAIEPIIANQNFYKILSEFQKEIKPTVNDQNSYPDIY